MDSTSSLEVNTEIKLFSKVNGFCDKIFEKIKEEEKKLPYHINIIDLLRANENAHSRILGRLLEQKNGENYEILNSFLSLLAERNSNFSNLNVQEPTISCEKRRIDILIKDKNYAIIFENKIHNAIDQERQIERYIDKVKEQYCCEESEIYLLYLSADGRKKPTAESLGKYKNTDLKDKRYIQLNFRYDILSWLKGKVLPDVRIKDVHLISAIEQYIDHLEGFFNLRTIQESMNIELQEEILKQLNIKEKSVQEKLTVLNKKIEDIERVKKQLMEVKIQIGIKILEEHFQNLKKDFPNCSNSNPILEIINNTDEDYPRIGLKITIEENIGFRVLMEVNKMEYSLYYTITRLDNEEKTNDKVKNFLKSFLDAQQCNSENCWYLKKEFDFKRDIYNQFKKFVEEVIEYCEKNKLGK